MAMLEDYTLLKTLGQGSFAQICKVRHNTLGYVRALKISNAFVDSKDSKEYKTFLEECKLLLRIGNGCHPNIVRIYKPDLKDNRAFVEQDFIDGETLNDYIVRKKFLDIDEVYRFIKEIGSALAMCHYDIYQFLMNPVEDDLTDDPKDASKYIIDDAKRKELVEKYRVIHNDLHSNNVMRRRYDGAFILLDFGLAIQNNHCVKSSSRDNGAVEYKAPEKWENDSLITTQSDVYGMGVLMFEALAGRVPFVLDRDRYSSEQACNNALYEMHRHQLPPDILPIRKENYEFSHPGKTYTRDYPEWLETIIRKCLAKNKEDRYVDAKELFDDFIAHYSEENVTGSIQLEKADKEIARLKTMLDRAETKASEDDEANKSKIRDLESKLDKAEAQAIKDDNANKTRIRELESNLTGRESVERTLRNELYEKNTRLSDLEQKVSRLEKKAKDVKEAKKTKGKPVGAWALASFFAVLSVILLISKPNSADNYEIQSLLNNTEDLTYLNDHLLDSLAQVNKRNEALEDSLALQRSKLASAEDQSAQAGAGMEDELAKKDSEIAKLQRNLRDANKKIENYKKQIMDMSGI